MAPHHHEPHLPPPPPHASTRPEGCFAGCSLVLMFKGQQMVPWVKLPCERGAWHSTEVSMTKHQVYSATVKATETMIVPSAVPPPPAAVGIVATDLNLERVHGPICCPVDLRLDLTIKMIDRHSLSRDPACTLYHQGAAIKQTMIQAYYFASADTLNLATRRTSMNTAPWPIYLAWSL